MAVKSQEINKAQETKVRAFENKVMERICGIILLNAESQGRRRKKLWS